MTVLNPEYNLLAWRGRREARIAVRWPRIGVVCRGKRSIAAVRRIGTVVAEDVEGVLDDIVPGRSDRMEKQLAAEFGQAEARANFAAVENDCAGSRPALCAPLGKNCTVAAKQRHPAGDRVSAVARPII